MLLQILCGIGTPRRVLACRTDAEFVKHFQLSMISRTVCAEREPPALQASCGCHAVASCDCHAVAEPVKQSCGSRAGFAHRGNHQHLVQRATAAQAAIEEQRRLQQQRLQEAQAAEQQYKQLLSRLDPANACAPRMSPGCCPLPWVCTESASCLRTFCMAELGIRGWACDGRPSSLGHKCCMAYLIRAVATSKRRQVFVRQCKSTRLHSDHRV
jgi:hypothetical protein